MKRLVPALIIAAALLPSHSIPGKAADRRALTGEYKWHYQNEPGSLRAVFSPAGQGEWDVVFQFTFDGSKRTYTGTATGGLSLGELSGTVKNENGRRTFIFSGEFEDGVFRGRHAEIRRGSERKTGTLTLSE